MPPRPRLLTVEERRLRSQALFESFRTQLLRVHFPIHSLVLASEDPDLDVWSHGDSILVRNLRNLLPFGRHLLRSDVDNFVDHTLEQLSHAALEQLFYWHLAGTTNSLNEPLEHIILTEDEDHFWIRYIPQHLTTVHQLLSTEQHVYYLTRFYLTHDRIEVGFNEIRLVPSGPVQSRSFTLFLKDQDQDWSIIFYIFVGPGPDCSLLEDCSLYRV